MKRFLVLYQAPISAMDQMKGTTPEQMKAGMDAWMAWAKKAGASIVDLGAPLGNGQAVTKGAVGAGTTKVVGYSIMQAESAKHITDLMLEHPHLHPPGLSIEVLEALPMPGM